MTYTIDLKALADPISDRAVPMRDRFISISSDSAPSIYY